MKILFLSSYVDPGSGASILIRLANRLKEEGHEVKILTTSCGYDSDIVEAVRLPAGLEFINRIINKIINTKINTDLFIKLFIINYYLIIQIINSCLH